MLDNPKLVDELLALDKPELRKAHGMVYEIWEDGEITLQKCGELYGMRNLHCIVPGFSTVNIPLPYKLHHNHSNMALEQNDIPRARAIMAELFGIVDIYADVLPGAKRINNAKDLIGEINARNTRIIANGDF